MELFELINTSWLVHGDKCDYSLVDLSNGLKVEIICKKHGSFWQLSKNHIDKENNCPSCKESKGERLIAELLHEKNISYIREHSFDDCRNIYLLRFDFYLPEHNTWIMFAGRQYFEEDEFFGGKEALKSIRINDATKNEYCKEHKINLNKII